ncbi:phosphomannomutase CpsG (plasmid) [Deltaproteobacteria bacterium Smac51]|nr:phosphomannomutase CpsG [Deltaproteobacteria bacterium Smac51]
MKLDCFKAYDVRGRLGEGLNGEIAWRIGRAYGEVLGPKTVAVGGDARLSSPELKAAVAEGLAESGAEVLDLGLTGTEEIYHAVFSQSLDGGIEVTGSHNPADENGLKMVKSQSRPISGDSGLNDIKLLAESGRFSRSASGGQVRPASFKEEYVEHLLGYAAPDKLPPLRIVANPGNGAAGPVMLLLERRLKDLGAPLEFVYVDSEPDGSFPNGLPNPLLPEKRERTASAVRENRADLGLAWDGDFDRCFFFDEHGNFIEGYYLVGLLAASFLAGHPGASIIHDPRLIWNTVDIVEKAGGRAVVSKTGHAFIKERMRLEKAVYGGEMSAHHYFSKFSFCDSGMIPWLLVMEVMGRENASLGELVSGRQALFPCSGEINYKVADQAGLLSEVESVYCKKAGRVDYIDGFSAEMPDWRFNIRTSNTEPLVRLNLETRGQKDMVADKVSELEKIITPYLVGI